MEERTALETQTPADADDKPQRAWRRDRLLPTIAAFGASIGAACRSLSTDRLLLLTIASVFAADQLTKFIIKSNMRIGESWPSEGLVRITHGTNTGTAFGLLPNQTLFLIFASLIAIGFLVYFYRAYALPKPILRFAIGLQLGGAFGNLFDRIAFGAVTDFIHVGWWPIFNIADSSICVGMATLAIVVILFDRTPKAQAAAEPDAKDPN